MTRAEGMVLLRHRAIGGALFGAVLLLAGCGGRKAESDQASATPGGGAASVATVSPYDSGPRAGETAANEALAEKGEKLFKDKGCSACHGFGRRISCPDLNGVTMRRTALWLENQILHPDKMTKEDPIARQLFAQFALQMPNQGLTQDEARAVIEYLKHKNHEATESH